MRPPAAAREAHRFLGCAEKGLGLVDAFLVFAFGYAVGDDAHASLHIHLALLDDCGAQHDASIHLAVSREVADTPSIDVALVLLKFVDVL